MPKHFESGPKFNNLGMNNRTNEQSNFRRESIRKSEITSEELERVEKSKMTIDDKINLLLTMGGLKPASEILLVIKTRDDKGLTEHISEEEVQEALGIIQESSLPYRFKDRETIQEPYRTKKEPKIQRFYRREQMKILLGRTSEELEFLERALKSKSDEMLGKAFGFPPTTIEAFIGKREVLNRQSLPSDIKHSDGILFSSPTLSRDNWQEEIKQGQRYGEFIKKLSPKLYEETRSMALKNLENSDF